MKEQEMKANEKVVSGLDIHAEAVVIHGCGGSKVVVNIMISSPTNLENYIVALYTKTIEDTYGIRVFNFMYKDNIIIIEGSALDGAKITKATGTIAIGTYRVDPPAEAIGCITSKNIERCIGIEQSSVNDIGVQLRTESDGTISFYIPKYEDDKSIRMTNNRVYYINTGMKLHIPKGYALQVFIHPSMICKYGITIPGGFIYYLSEDSNTEFVIPVVWDGNPRMNELDWQSRLKLYPSDTVLARGILIKYIDAKLVDL